MTRNHVIALAVGVLLVGFLGFVLYRRSQGDASKTILGGQVPPYVPGGSLAGPPAPASNKISNAFQQITSVFQAGDDAIVSGKKTWSDAKDFFA